MLWDSRNPKRKRFWVGTTRALGVGGRSLMKHVIWTALATLAASIGLALFAGKDDIRRLYRMRRM